MGTIMQNKQKFHVPSADVNMKRNREDNLTHHVYILVTMFSEVKMTRIS